MFDIRDYGSIAGLAGPIFVSYRIGTVEPYFAECVPQNGGASLVNSDSTIELSGGQFNRYVWVRNETATSTSFTLSGGFGWIDFPVLRDYGSLAGFEGPVPIGFTIAGGTGGSSSVARIACAVPQNEGASLVVSDYTIEFAGGRYTHYFWVRNETGVPTSLTLSLGRVSDFFIPFYGFLAGFGGPIPVGYTVEAGAGSRSAKAHFAAAVPMSNGASLVSTGHTVEFSGGRYTHYFWVRNETSAPTFFALSGGALN